MPDYILEFRFEADHDLDAKESVEMILEIQPFHTLESDLLYRVNEDGSREGI